jgi:endonuclease/exonuclease/phosphatase family metal-dependent hydrolase
MPHVTSAPRGRTARLASACVALALAAALAPAGHHATADPSPAAARTTTSETLRIATFNILGASHTTKPASGFDTYEPRMRRTVRLIERRGFDIVGLQEYQTPQHELFLKRTAGAWGVYPGLQEGRRPVQNSIVWRKSEWRLVEKHLYEIPYFNGTMVPQPYVRLQHTDGHEVWVVNTHNPADARGPAQKWRDQAVAIQADLANELRATGVPVFVVGDFNDRDEAFCDLTGLAPHLTAANGGGWRNQVCDPPPRSRIDWIFLSKILDVLAYREIPREELTHITDHNVIYADVAVPLS